MKYAKRRDINEPAVIAALKAAGCAVWQVGDMGVPDLIVSRDGVVHLLEVKTPGANGKCNKHRGSLTPAQVKSWAAWEAMGGRPVTIVTSPAEALAAVGVPCGE